MKKETKKLHLSFLSPLPFPKTLRNEFKSPKHLKLDPHLDLPSTFCGTVYDETSPHRRRLCFFVPDCLHNSVAQLKHVSHLSHLFQLSHVSHFGGLTAQGAGGCVCFFTYIYYTVVMDRWRLLSVQGLSTRYLEG